MLDIDTSDWRPIPHAEAAALLRGKPPVTRDLFDRLLPEYRARAFLITGIDSADALAESRDLLATVPEGADWDVVKRQLISRLSPWLGEESARRAELLMRHHIYQAYAVTNTLHLDAQSDIFPYRQYITAQDERVRASHAALNKIVLPWNSPFWDNHTPPWGYGCRCDVVGLSEDDAQDIRAEDANRDPDKALFLDGPLKRRLEEAGELVRGPNEIYQLRKERGPRWSPRDLRIPIDTLQERYASQPDVWAEFERWARETTMPGLRISSDQTAATVWRWTAGEAIEKIPAVVTRLPLPVTPPPATPIPPRAMPPVPPGRLPIPAPAGHTLVEAREMTPDLAVQMGKPWRRDILSATVPGRTPGSEISLEEAFATSGPVNLWAEQLTRDEYRVEKAAREALRERAALKFREELATRLASVRPTGETVTHHPDSKTAAKKLVDRAAKRFPDDWTRRISNVQAKVIRGRCSAWTAMRDYTQRVRVKGHGKVYVAPRSGDAKMTTNTTSTNEHEFAHIVQEAHPELDALFVAEHLARTTQSDGAREALVHLVNDEYARADGYYDAYQGKEYHNGPKEVMTMALEPLLGQQGPAVDHRLSQLIAKDPRMLDLALGVLFHVK